MKPDSGRKLNFILLQNNIPALSNIDVMRMEEAITKKVCVYTAISRKVVGKKCARDNPEWQYGI